MWVFHPNGFFSATCAKDESGGVRPDVIQVRARVRSHLEWLRREFPAARAQRIIRVDHADYRFRIILPKGEWAKIVAAMAEATDYPNFKSAASAAGRGAGQGRYVAALHRVWQAMYELQEQADRGGDTRSPAR